MYKNAHILQKTKSQQRKSVRRTLRRHETSEKILDIAATNSSIAGMAIEHHLLNVGKTNTYTLCLKKVHHPTTNNNFNCSCPIQEFLV